jgi:hypothetical protein
MASRELFPRVISLPTNLSLPNPSPAGSNPTLLSSSFTDIFYWSRVSIPCRLSVETFLKPFTTSLAEILWNVEDSPVFMVFKRFSLSISQADNVEQKEWKRIFKLLRSESNAVEFYVSSSDEMHTPFPEGSFP